MAILPGITSRFSFGQTVSDLFSVTGNRFLLMAGLMILCAVVPAIPQYLINYLSYGTIAPDPATLAASGQSILTPLFLLGLVVGIASYVIMGGSMTHVGLGYFEGRRDRLGEALRVSMTYFWRILGIGICFTLILIIAYFAFLLIMAALIGGLAFSSGGGAAAGFGTVIVLLILVPVMIVALGYIQAIWYVALPACIAEDLDVFESFGRSRALTSGNRWKIFAILLLLNISLLIVFSVVVGAMVPLLSLGDPAALASGGTMIILSLAMLCLSIPFGVVYAASLTAVYINLRRAKEGVTVNDTAAVFG